MIGSTRVKICGLTRLEDAELAIALGADALGFVFWPASPRVLSPERARVIARALPPFVTRVGVFVNITPADVAAIADEVGLDAVQLHGDENVEDYRCVNRRLIRSISLDDDAAVAAAAVLPGDVMPLVDAADAIRRGGTGRLANWDHAAVLARTRQVMLAGGLTHQNVADAVRRVRPWAVDVSSGVEERPGVKSPSRLREFFAELERIGMEGK